MGFHIFIQQDHGEYKHQNVRFVSLHINLFPEKILKITIYRVLLSHPVA